jgi:class 3 adenylate cyclase/predicted ATPase
LRAPRASENASMTFAAAWLKELGVAQYAEVFAEHAIDFGVISNLTEVDLEKLGIPFGHRKRMLKAIGALAGAMRAADTAQCPIAPPRPSAERRQLTILFCDLVGSTALASELDPEDLSGVLHKFQDTCAAVIEQAGGYLAKYMGDGVLVYFGYPQAHEDEAERAVRAGLALVARVGQLVLPSGELAKVRVGIATGMVIVGETVGEGSSRETEAVGQTLNMAARLQEIASPNTVTITTSTRRLLGDGFAIEELGLYNLKGISEPVLLWRVTGERVVVSRFDAIRSKKLTEFVGRREELRQLMAVWQRARKGDGQVALLCGEAGIGKSRITKTLRDYTAGDRHIMVSYQCSPYHTNSPLYPVISQLRYTARFESNDAPEIKLDKLEKLLARSGPELLRDIGLYAALLSLPTHGRYPELDLTPQRQKELTIESLVRQLLHLTSLQPVLFIFEDVHWIDPTTLELLNRALSAIKAAPILFVITFRPEFFPPWLNEAHVMMLRLGRLERNDVAAMILHLTSGKELPAEVCDQILSKTDGIPLFVEEITKAVLEAGHLQDTGEGYVIGDTRAVTAIPATLHDSLMARLDRMAPIKEVPQTGAALGREFSYRLLAAVVPVGEAVLRNALEQLSEAELIFSRGEPPDSVYTFKHALIQEAAYGSLLRSKRQQLHARIAEVLKEQLAETIETQPELMAHHLAQAGLIEPAIEYLQKAGQQAIQRSANAEAIGHLEHAAELLQSLPGSPERTRVACGLQVMLGEAMIAGRGYAAPETKQALLRAKALMDASTEPSQKFAVLYGIWAQYYVAGEVAMQREAAAEFVVEAEQSGERASLCLALRTLGTTYVTMGDFAAGRQHLERARGLYDPESHAHFRFQYGQDIGATVMCYLGWALWHLGYVDQASDVAVDAVKHAGRVSHPLTLAYTICHARGMMDIFRRRAEETQSYAAKVSAICTELGFPFWGAGAQILNGWALARGGDVEGGIETLRAGLAAWRKTGARLWLPMFHTLEAEALAKAGCIDAALQAVEQALAISDETGERWALAEVLRVKAGLFSAAGRASDDVEALLVKSKDIARFQKARLWELRTTCDLARIWQSQTRVGEALNSLREIYDQFTEGFETADLQAADALLKSLSTNWIPCASEPFPQENASTQGPVDSSAA